MSNVIKQRQLSNGDKLTPKTDFTYTNNTDNTVIYNINGTQKGTINVEFSLQNNYMSVGKGDYLYVDSNGYLKYFDKKGTFRNQIQIDPAASSYVISKKVATFLGKPFQAEGDNDRYVILNYWNVELGRYEGRLLNIDTWELQTRVYFAGGENPLYDFVYNGVDKIYAIASTTGVIRYCSINTETIINNTNITDSTGANVNGLRIYGASDKNLFYKSIDTKQVTRYTFADGAVDKWGSPDSENLNALSFYVPETDESWMLMSNDTNGVWLRNFQNTFTVFLNDSLLAANVIGSGESGIVPVLITDYVETDSDITIDWVLVREAQFTNGDFATKAVQTTINKSSGNIVSTKIGDTFGLTYTSIDTAINSFSNSCNSYGIGKFYDYGLQKQWDEYKEWQELTKKDLVISPSSTSFIYSNNNTLPGNPTSIYDIDGTTATEALTRQQGSSNITHVGNDEYITTSGTVMYHMTGNRVTLNQIDIGYNTDIDKRVITFLGRPFTTENDYDRYVLVNYYNGTGYSLMLLNIDKWTYQLRDLSTSSIMYDLTFDGVDTCYLIRAGELHQITIRLNDFDSTPQSTIIVFTGEIKTDRIYGVNQTEVLYRKTNECNLKKYIISENSISFITGDATRPILNVVQMPVIKEDGEDYVLLSYDSGQIRYMDTDANVLRITELQQSLVDAGVITSGEDNVTPQLITNYIETDTTIEFDWVLTRRLESRVVGDCVRTTITKSDDSVVSTRLTTASFDPIAPAGTSQEQLNNAFSHTRNSYGAGKFYNYGIQKQWDEYKEWQELTKKDLVIPPSSTSFIYSNNKSIPGNPASIYNIDGTVATEALTKQQGSSNITHVGNDEYITTSGTVMYHMKGNRTVLNQMDIRYNPNIDKSIITFLGTPFIADGDTDRYIVVTIPEDGATRSAPHLVNINTWTVVRRLIPWQSGISYDPTYDGGYWVYWVRGYDGLMIRSDIRTADIFEIIEDSGTNRIYSKRIYGIINSDGRLIYKDLNNKLNSYNPQTKVIGNLFGGAETYNAIIPNGYSDWYMYAGVGGDGVTLRTRLANIKTGDIYELAQGMIDATGIIGAGELDIYPTVVLSFEETDTDVTMVWHMFRKGQIGNPIALNKTVKTILNKSDGTNSSARISPEEGFPFDLSSNIDENINSFSNTSNSYAEGKFYDYGLQKQWDSTS